MYYQQFQKFKEKVITALPSLVIPLSFIALWNNGVLHVICGFFGLFFCGLLNILIGGKIHTYWGIFNFLFVAILVFGNLEGNWLTQYYNW